MSVVVDFESGKLFAETVKFLDNDMHLAADRFVRSLYIHVLKITIIMKGVTVMTMHLCGNQFVYRAPMRRVRKNWRDIYFLMFT